MVEGTHASHEKRTTAQVTDYPLARLDDPLEDRVMKDVPIPPKYPLTAEDLYKKQGKITHQSQALLSFLSITLLNSD